MTQQKSISKNMFMNVLLTASNFVFPLITYSYVARVLTATGTGKVAFISSVISYFVKFARLGVAGHGRRECAKLKDNKEALSRVVHELLCLNGITVLISYIALLITIHLVPMLQSYKALILIMSIQIVLTPMGIEWFYQGMEEYSYITKRSLLFKCFSVMLTFLLVRDKEDVLWYGAISIFTVCASNVCNIWQLRKYIYVGNLGHYDLLKHVKPVLMLFASSIAISVYSNFDVTMLGFISTENEVGLYNAAVKIETIVLSLSTAVTAVLVPRMASYFGAGQTDSVKELASKTIRISLLLALPLALYIFIFAENVLLFIGGESFVSAGDTLRIKMLCVVPMTFSNLFGNQLLIPMGKENRYTQSVTIGVFINLFLNFLFIPRLGAVGAALGTLATECWNMLWMGLYVKEYVASNVQYIRYCVPMLVSALVAYTVGYLVNTFNVFWQLTITASIFLGIYYIIQYAYREPIVYQYINRVCQKLWDSRKI